MNEILAFTEVLKGMAKDARYRVENTPKGSEAHVYNLGQADALKDVIVNLMAIVGEPEPISWTEEVDAQISKICADCKLDVPDDYDGGCGA